MPPDEDAKDGHAAAQRRREGGGPEEGRREQVVASSSPSPAKDPLGLHLPVPVPTETDSDCSGEEEDDEPENSDWRRLLTAGPYLPRETEVTSGHRGDAGLPTEAASSPAPTSSAMLQSRDMEEPYDVLDQYVDDLLGVASNLRPPGWQGPPQPGREDAPLKARAQLIIYESGELGPPRSVRKQDSREAVPELGGMLSGWAKVDGSSVGWRIVEAGAAPAAKQRAAPGPRHLATGLAGEGGG